MYLSGIWSMHLKVLKQHEILRVSTRIDLPPGNLSINKYWRLSSHLPHKCTTQFAFLQVFRTSCCVPCNNWTQHLRQRQGSCHLGTCNSSRPRLQLGTGSKKSLATAIPVIKFLRSFQSFGQVGVMKPANFQPGPRARSYRSDLLRELRFFQPCNFHLLDKWEVCHVNLHLHFGDPALVVHVYRWS